MACCLMAPSLKEMLKTSILDKSLKIANSKLQPHLPGANELMLKLHF